MLTQVLILHGQLAFAIALKQGLERTNLFEVHPFLSVDAALDYLGDHVQDVALVDFGITEMQGAEIVRRFREIQADLAVVATPEQPSEVINALALQGVLDAKFSVRELAPLLRDLFREQQRPSEIWEAERPRAPTKKHEPRVKRVTPPPAPPTRPIERMPAPPPKDLPEVTSLEHILANMEDVFQPGSSEDTPVDNETSSMWEVERREGDLFDEVLNSLPVDADVEAPKRSNPFEDLVNSMRSGEPHQPLPTRRQDYVEFVFKGGLESLYDQIDNVSSASQANAANAAGADTPVEPAQPVLDESSRIFERLKREEPPRPTLEESGTIHDLIMGVEDPSFHNVLAMLRDEPLLPIKPQTPPAPAQPSAAPTKRDEFDFDFDDLPPLEKSEPSPAKQILEQALEQSVTQEGFSLEELLSNIERQLPRHRPRVQPLPSWIRESQQRTSADSARFMTSEPDFLPEILPEVNVEPDFEAEVPDFEPFGEGDEYDSRFVDQLTQPSAAQPIESLPEETQWLESQRAGWGEYGEDQPDFHEETQSYTKPYPKETAPFDAPFDLPEDVPQNARRDAPDNLPEFPTFTAENFNTSFELLAAFEVVDDVPFAPDRYEFTVGRIPMPPLEGTPVPPKPSVPSAAADDPRIAQLALSLTEASLELTAEGTVLTRGGEIVAYAGQLGEDDILELRPFIPMEGSSIPSGSVIRFVSATDSPKNYMLYSARTDDDLILSLVFASTTPLRDIRRQGARLAEALHTVPEPPPVELEFPQSMLLEPLDAGARTPYTYVWLVDNPTQTLDGKVRQGIQSALRVQLGEKGWQLQELRVEEDYLYLLAEVPGETMPYEIIRDLKRRSAEIAHKQNADLDPDLLWSDGYLVVAPGRSLDVDEIQQFINFERMG